MLTVDKNVARNTAIFHMRGPLWARYKDITDGQQNHQMSTMSVFKKVYLTNKSGVQNPL